MAILFLDSSGIVKRYVSETGSVWAQSLTDPVNANECYVAQITGAEVASAIIRRVRRGDLTLAEAAIALSGFEADFTQNLVLLENSLPRIRDAMVLTRQHGLRGYDSVQLSGHAKEIRYFVPTCARISVTLRQSVSKSR